VTQRATEEVVLASDPRMPFLSLSFKPAHVRIVLHARPSQSARTFENILDMRIGKNGSLHTFCC
jgi:hypothetical protein